MTVEIANLGTWGGATLVAEYDPEDDAIRVDARAVERVRAALGDAEAATFVALACAHERFHRDHPDGSECDAVAYAERATGTGGRRFERVLART